MNDVRHGAPRISPCQRRGLLLVACVCLLLRSGAATAGPHPVAGSVTIDLRAGGTPGEDHTRVERVAATIDARLTPRLQLYTDTGWRDEDGVVDELYAAYQRGATRLRLGRFYLPIGIHAYSELYYTGFALAPLVKYQGYRGFRLHRPEQGLSVEAGRPDLRLEAAVMGGDGSQAAVGLDRPEDVSLRLQTARGRWILGLNGFAATIRVPLASGAIGERALRVGGLDWRYSSRSWIVRGEYLKGKISSYGVSGGYVDVIYHPEALPAWTFVARAEVLDLRDVTRRFTVGARHVPAPGWIVQLNWGEGNPSRATRLLLLQVVRAIDL